MQNFWVITLETIIVIIVMLYIFYKFYFLRNPSRETLNNNDILVSPANGKIISIIHQNDLTNQDRILYKKYKKVIDDRTEGFTGATLVSIMMTPMNVHFQKAPTKAKLISQTYQKGNFFNATKTKNEMRSTFQNEYNNMLFKTAEGFHFRVIQIAGALARRIVPELEINEEVTQGQRIGLIKLGSQVSFIIDSNYEIVANIGDKVIDGETIIAKKK